MLRLVLTVPTIVGPEIAGPIAPGRRAHELCVNISDFGRKPRRHVERVRQEATASPNFGA